MRKPWCSWLAICAICLLAVAASAADQSTVKGWVSDSTCGAKGANADHVACTKKCLGKGAKLVVVTDDSQQVLTVDNPDALKGHEGHHVAVTGEVTNGSIHVETATMI